MHFSRRRLLRRGLEFHVCTMKKSAHIKKSLETYLMILVYLYIYLTLHATRTQPKVNFKRSLSGLKSEFYFPRSVAIPRLKTPRIYIYIYIYILVKNHAKIYSLHARCSECIYQPSDRARSIFKQSIIGLNSMLSFSLVG